MNSWHSWSPNGKWLVFSSKLNGPYTQLLLTHIDEQGYSTPPVVLENFTAADRAANIPEFVRLDSDRIKNIREQFVDDYSFVRAAEEYVDAEDPAGAARIYLRALKLNPKNAEAHSRLGIIRAVQGRFDEARTHLVKAAQCQPDDAAHQRNLGILLMRHGKLLQAAARYRRALQLDPHDPTTLTDFAFLLATAPDPELRNGEEAVQMALKACESAPEKDATMLDVLATAYAETGRFSEAVQTANEALRLARDAGAHELAQQIDSRLQVYRQSRKPGTGS